MSTKLRKKLYLFIFLIVFTMSIFCTSLSYNVNAATSSLQSSSSAASKVAATKSTNSKATSSKSQNNSKVNSSQSESLLPSDGNSLPPAATQNWDQIMSDINNTADKDEFTFSEEPSHLGFFGSKLSYIGFGLILLAILGFTYFFYSSFFSKKSPRKLKKFIMNNINPNKNISNNHYPNKQIQQRRPNPSNKSVYSDGYGYTRTPQQIRPVRKSTSNNIDKPIKNNLPKPKAKNNNINLNSNNVPKAKHMLEDDTENIIMSSDNSSRNINNFNNRVRNNRKSSNKKINKKDEFWNDFFLN